MEPTRWNKICAWTNVLKHIILMDGLVRLSALFLFIPAYWMRNWKHNPLWRYLQDDTNNQGVPEENIKTKWNFLRIYNECAIRNFADNWQQKLKLNGDYKNLWYAYCETYTYNAKTLHKFVDKAPNTWMVRPKFYNNPADPLNVHNKGEYLSFEFSFFGRKKYYFQRNGKWYVLLSISYIRKYRKGKYRLREINIGASDRILIRNKWPKGK